MSIPLPREARSGDELTPRDWEDMRAANRAVRILPGLGYRRRLTPFGTILQLDELQVSFAHYFQCGLSPDGREVTVRPGRLNAVIVPTIKKVELEADEAPRLELPDPVPFNADGRSWIALEVTCDEKFRAKSAEVIHAVSLDGKKHAEGEDRGADAGAAPALAGRKTRHPLALLVRREDDRIELFQIAYFNLRHVAAGTGDAVRHYFSAA